MEQNTVSLLAQENFDAKMNLQNMYNFQYMGTFYFGQDRQPLKLLLDTGSSWTWVAGEECTESEGCPNSRLKRTASF